eukprot:TCONS_00027503-protein
MATLVEKLRKNWFMVGIVVFILLAKMAPWIGMKGGPLHPEFTIKYMAVMIIFFNSGLSLKSEDLKAALFHYRLHIFIQGFTFVFFPLCMTFLMNVLPLADYVNKHLVKGIRVVSCMPPPVSSAVIITKAIGGNEAGAIFNSAMGSFLGIFVTPVLLLTFVGIDGNVPVMSILQTLTITVVIPLALGQYARSHLKKWMEETKPPLSQIGSFMLLLIIYSTFCDTFSTETSQINAKDLLIVGILIFLIQTSFMYLIFSSTSAGNIGYSKEDVVALMFCSTHKSLTLGMPILKIIYAGDAILPFISIPLLIYHPTQILLGSVLVPFVKSWLLSTDLPR